MPAVTRTFTQVELADPRGVVFTSASGVGGDPTSGIAVQGFGELSFQYVGDATTVTITGSNDGGVTWGGLTPAVTSTTSGKIVRIPDHPGLLRAELTAGTGTVVYIAAAKQFY